MIKPKEANETDKGKEERDLPSVMAFHAKYRTPTVAVSRIVATKEPSTLELEPYETSQQSCVSNKLEAPMSPRRSLD